MSGTDNAAFRLSWGQFKIHRSAKAGWLGWLFIFPGVAWGESLLCQHKPVCLDDITDAPTVRAYSLLQGHSRRGTWAAGEEETEDIRAAASSGYHNHAAAEDVRHSISSVPQSIAVWINSMFSSVAVANWTAGTVLQSSFVRSQTNITKLMQTLADYSQPAADDIDGTNGMIVDRDVWADQLNDGQNIATNLLPLQLHLQGMSLDVLMDKIAETHSIFLRYYDSRHVNASHAARPGIIKGDSIAQLVEILRSEFSKVCHLPESKFLMSSVHGRFLRPKRASEFLQHNTSDVELLQGLQSQLEIPGSSNLVSVVEEPDQRIAEEVVVRFFVLGSDSGVQNVIDELRTELGDKDSKLMRGKLSKLLQRASITVGYENSYMLSPNHVRGIEGLAMPVIVSVIFMMLLMWLSSV